MFEYHTFPVITTRTKINPYQTFTPDCNKESDGVIFLPKNGCEEKCQ